MGPFQPIQVPSLQAKPSMGMKLQLDGQLALDVFIHVNNGRITGWSELAFWEATWRFCSVWNNCEHNPCSDQGFGRIQ